MHIKKHDEGLPVTGITLEDESPPLCSTSKATVMDRLEELWDVPTE